jgi:DME family drug/metabolite transporter
MTHGTTAPRRRDATWLVALGAALWGSDALLRVPLVGTYPASTIVFLEHVVIVLVTLPWLLPALRAFASSSARTKAAVLVIGAGASALATVLFTQAFVHAPATSAAITPVVLQKLQPVIAVLVAYWLLKERITLRYPLFLVPALVGAWLLAFPDPTSVSVAAGLSAALAVGAAALWATGTVLGRLVGAEIGLRDLTVLRFAIGLPASLLLVLLLRDPLTASARDLPVIALLGLIPGLLAIGLYYRGLRRTPASRATLAELAFPLTAAVVGVVFLDNVLSGTQWLGAAVVAASVTALALHERFSSHKAVATPAPVEEAVPVPAERP